MMLKPKSAAIIRNEGRDAECVTKSFTEVCHDADNIDSRMPHIIEESFIIFEKYFACRDEISKSDAAPEVAAARTSTMKVRRQQYAAAA